jgi:DNA-binding PadR family transcriptional regulator
MSDPTLLVLVSLAEGEKHRYAMMLDIESFAGQRLGPGTLYGAITRLEECGWIQADASIGRRRPYRISAAGRDHLEVRITALDKIVRIAVRRLKQRS